MVEGAGGAPRALPGEIADGALLVIDVQGDFADPESLAAMGVPADSQIAVANAVEAMLELIDAARRAGLKVVWVRGQDSVPPWRSVLWLIGREESGAGLCVPGTPGFEFWKVAPAGGEPIVTKSRYSGFVRTELESLLLERGVTWVACCGLTSACCVSSTAWDAMQRDFRVIIVGDATAEFDQAMHEASLENMAENVGMIVSAGELAGALERTVKGSMAVAPKGGGA
jgi:nicotinamidase-related amidase